MKDSINLGSKPSLLLRFFVKLAGERSTLKMKDFPGNWTDMVYAETYIRFNFWERLKIFFMKRIIVKHYVLCEKEPGKSKPIVHVYIGHPLDDKNYQLQIPKETE